MTQRQTITVLWLLLIGLTLGGALLGETAKPGLVVALPVILSIALKGRLVIDYFMEMKHANRTLRTLMRLYFIVLPLITLLVYLFGGHLARLTSL